LKKPDFIYFDIDDTLLDHMSAQKAALKNVYHHFSCLQQISLDTFQQAYKHINSGLWEQYSLGKVDRIYLERHRFTDTFEVLGIQCTPYRDVAEFYMRDYRSHWSWINGAEKALERLSASYKIGFITNGFTETQKLKVSDFGLNRFSETIIISEEVGYLKPDPKIFRFAESKAGAQQEAILYVGDSLTSDVKGGKSAGWQVAWYNTINTQIVEHHADFMFDDFNDLVERLSC
jgi:putative hydrolase of the HAD superfamily